MNMFEKEKFHYDALRYFESPTKVSLFKRLRYTFPLPSDVSLGHPDIKFAGSFSFDEVKRIHQLIGCHVRYGICPEFGLVAIVGLPNPKFQFGWFSDVDEYGKVTPMRFVYKFKGISERKAKSLSNFTVFALVKSANTDLNLIINAGFKFEKIHYTFDKRYQANNKTSSKVFYAHCQIEGPSTCQEIKDFNDAVHQYFYGSSSVTFATLADGRHIAILGMSYDCAKHFVGFRDVLEFGEEEPEIFNISFMNDVEAANYNDFTLYLRNYNFTPVTPQGLFKILKEDCSFDKGFDFYSNPNHDYRLS